MKKHIFVNNTAATSGGALTILKEFIQNVAMKSSKDYIFYIFCTADLCEFQSENIKIIKNVNAKAWKDRIKWDLYGMKKWSRSNSITPNLIISLQNTSVSGFKYVNQIIYLHQSIPYYKEISWNILKKEERLYWFYKHIYILKIHKSVKHNDVVVQSYWMKDSIERTHKLDENRIHVIKPTVNKIEKNMCKEGLDNKYIKLFYPAAPHIYKNHIILIKALYKLKNQFKSLNFKLYFTFNINEDKYTQTILEIIKQLDLNEEIEFLGNLNYKDMQKYYSQSDIVVFPSYIETYGLPLIEAAYMGKSIVAADLNYAKEVLSTYNGVFFANYKDVNEWSNLIMKAYKNKNKEKLLKLDLSNSWDKFIEIIDEKIN
ncbi:MAG: glycosyltransferase [Paraclostridium sp.]